jgi:hypothetical protein
MRDHLRKVFRRLLREESGQSLIVVVSSMTVLLGMAGFGIDTASWMVRHHQDQIVADAAALAAAHCLANPGQSGSSVEINGKVTSVPSCTSGTDSPDATTVAVDYAAANGLTITASQVNVDTANGHVTVDASNGSESLFAELFGIKETTQQANATAGWEPKGNQCTSAGSTCDFMFANSDNCSSGSYVLIVSTQGSSTINGDIQTNGSLDASATGNAGGINGTGTYGPGSCTTSTGGNHDPWNTAPPTQASQTIKWPIDYSTDFPDCGGSTDPCSTSPGTSGYPSFCTNAGANITIDNTIPADQPEAGQIYCASGTGTASEPGTWNGNISINIGGSGNNNVYEDSFVGGTIDYTGGANATFSACGYTANGYSSAGCSGAPAPAGKTANYPIFYAAVDKDPDPSSCASGANLSTSCAFYMTSTGNLTVYGDFFVQNGTASINLQGNQSAGDTFIEANVIGATLAGNFNGDGPSPGGGGGSNSGTDVLLQ